MGEKRASELALVEDPANVARCLAAVGEATEVPRRSPGRGPPYWNSRVLRQQTLGEEDDEASSLAVLGLSGVQAQSAAPEVDVIPPPGQDFGSHPPSVT
jgi:hypothetical protein